MSEMIDRLTDILMSDGCGDSDQCEKTARRIIAAMREPTRGMVQAQPFLTGQIISRMSAGEISTAIYRAMIDAALGEG